MAQPACPALAWCWPAGQVRQAGCPTRSWKVPMAHGAQLRRPSCACAAPSGQGSHTRGAAALAAACSKLPARHAAPPSRHCRSPNGPAAADSYCPLGQRAPSCAATQAALRATKFCATGWLRATRRCTSSGRARTVWSPTRCHDWARSRRRSRARASISDGESAGKEIEEAQQRKQEKEEVLIIIINFLHTKKKVVESNKRKI